MTHSPWTRFAIALAAVACERSKTPAPDPQQKDPRPARPAASVSEPRRAFARFHSDEASQLHVELRAPDARLTAAIRVLRADLLVDPLDLAGTRGELRADLGSLIVHADKALERQRFTTDAHNWLDIGASRPEAERTRLRWARFTITELTNLSASAAHTGRTLATLLPWDHAPEGAADAASGSAPDAASGDSGPSVEPGPTFGPLRAVDLVAVGDLTFHGFRTQASVALTVIFEFAGEPRPGVLPRRVVVRNREPLVVSLKAHDIKPRDAHGVAVSRDFGLLGTKIARDARVSMAWVLVHTPAPGR
ncbi:MAG TPA: hypothetical protein VI072_20530 [Polyangiaceae bacterium]